MLAHNLCYTTLLEGGTSQARSLGLDPDRDCEISPHGDWFVREHVRKGLLPRVLRHLLDARGKAKRDMASEKDPSLVNVHDGRQLALKIVANAGAIPPRRAGRRRISRRTACRPRTAA